MRRSLALGREVRAFQTAALLAACVFVWQAAAQVAPISLSTPPPPVSETFTVEALFLAFGLSTKNVLAAAVGSFISLRFFEGLTPWERWTTFFSGTALGSWLAYPLIVFLEQKPTLEVGMALMIGLFGLAIASKGWQIVRDTVWVEFFFRVVGIIRGRNGGPPPPPPPGGNIAPPSSGG